MNEWMWVVFGVVAMVLWVARPLRPQVKQVAHPELATPSELAWGTGGPRRVRTTWFAVLQAEGGLRTDWFEVLKAVGNQRRDSDERRWTRLGTGPSLADPWVREAWAALPAGAMTSREVAQAWTPVLLRLQEHLAARGIAPSLEDESLHTVHSCWGAVVVAIATAIAASVAGMSVFLAVPAAFVLVALPGIFLGNAVSGGGVTRRGKAWTRHHRARRQAEQRAPERETLGWAVALGGAAVLAGTPFEALALPTYGRSGDGGSGGCGVGAITASGCGSAPGPGAASSGFDTGGGFGGGDSSSGCGGGGGGCGGD